MLLLLFWAPPQSSLLYFPFRIYPLLIFPFIFLSYFTSHIFFSSVWYIVFPFSFSVMFVGQCVLFVFFLLFLCVLQVCLHLPLASFGVCLLHVFCRVFQRFLVLIYDGKKDSLLFLQDSKRRITKQAKEKNSE